MPENQCKALQVWREFLAQEAKNFRANVSTALDVQHRLYDAGKDAARTVGQIGAPSGASPLDFTGSSGTGAGCQF